MISTNRLLCLAAFVSVIGNSSAQVNSLNINTPANEYAPAVSADGKTMIFQSNREGGYKLYESTLQSNGNWTDPKAITEINNTQKKYALIGGPSLTFDGNTLFFCAYAEGGVGDMDIYSSTRSNGTWSSPVNIGSPVNTDGYEGFPSISADGKKLYFTRSTKEEGCFKILSSSLSEAGSWTTPEELPNQINSKCVKAPKIHSDGKTLVFASKNNNGGFDLFRSVLSKDGKWGEPIAIDRVNSDKNESAAGIAALPENIYYSSEGDIYFTTVPADYILNKVSLNIQDGEKKKPMKGIVEIKDNKDQSKFSIDSSGTDGKYQIVLLPGKVYDFEVSYPGYNSEKFSASFMPNEEFKRIDKEILLQPRKRKVALKISDKETNKGLSVDIKVTNLETGEETILHETLGRDGKYSVNLREGNKYNIEVSSKEGYAYSTMKIEVPAAPPGTVASTSNNPTDSGAVTAAIVDLPELTHEIEVTPLKKGTKLVLKDIFFEFNAHELKDSSFVELNRLIELMNENPTLSIEIAAHTDDVGSDDFNTKLSQKRAQVIVDYLVSKGITSKRLKPIGYGKSKPVASNSTEEGRAKNRRVELKILGQTGN